MTMVLKWLEREVDDIDKQLAAKQIELDAAGLLETEFLMLDMELLQSVYHYLQAALAAERQKHEPDWQAECLEWRRGVGEFMEWLTPLVLHILGEENMTDANFKRALDTRLVYALVYHKCQELCPVAVINFDPPPLTSEELVEVNQAMKDEELR